METDPAQEEKSENISSAALRAIKPSLFHATFHPELIAGVLLANRVSPRLAELTRHAAHPFRPPVEPEAVAPALERLHTYVNRRFCHAKPLDMARIWGLHERERIRDASALEANDYTMRILSRAYREVMAFRPYAPLLEGFLDTGLFPEYVYPTVDGILGLASVEPARSGHAVGLTSCCDECLLLASLAFEAGCCDLEDIVLLGSPLHVVLFLFPKGTDGFFFNGKREFFTRATWSALVGAHPSRAGGVAFMERMFLFDRLITPYGCCLFPLGQGTLSQARLRANLARIGAFLEADLAALSSEVETGARAMPERESPDVDLLEALNRTRTADEAEHIVRGHLRNGSPLARAIGYTARWTDMPRAERYYAQAALTGYKAWIESAFVLTLDDALRRVRALPSRVSALGPGRRIALPDEALILDRADDNERALLLYTLLRLADRPTETPPILRVENDVWRVDLPGQSLTGADL